MPIKFKCFYIHVLLGSAGEDRWIQQANWSEEHKSDSPTCSTFNHSRAPGPKSCFWIAKILEYLTHWWIFPALPNPVSIAAATFTVNKIGAVFADFFVASYNLVLSVTSSSSLLEALLVWHVNAFAQLLQIFLKAHGIPRGAVKGWVTGKETSQCEFSQRLEEWGAAAASPCALGRIW